MWGNDPDPRDDVFALGVIWYQLMLRDLSKGAPTGLGWDKKLRSMGLSEGLIQLLGGCFAEDPDDFEAHVTMAAILNLDRDVDGAELHAKRAIDLRPSSPLALYQMARVERSRGDIQGAVLNFEKVIAAEPEWLRPHIELAALYYRLNRPDEGMKERAIVDKLYMQGKKLGPDAPFY